MNITITINSLDRTSSVYVNSLRIIDRINDVVNEALFTTTGYQPGLGEELTITDGSTTLFAGIITRVKQQTRGLKVTYEVRCKDYTHYLDRELVNQRYEDTTVEAIIQDIIDTYTTGFTYTNVACTLPVDTIAFNRITVTEAITRLAELTGYNWYVDYAKDIHFFAETAEVAPFSLTATGDNHIWDSLQVEEDISQLRNQVVLLGGEIEGAERSETYIADGDQLQFPLANKYAKEPTVTVDGVAQTVGIDFRDEDASDDCFWSFQEKYIRFKDATRPAADSAVVVTGIPLYPLVVSVSDPISINEYGTYEHKIKDQTIRSRDQAIERAKVDLRKYARELVNGSFKTTKSGLRSGQVITVDANGIAGDFILQTVELSMRGPSDGEYRVKMASAKVLGMVAFLRSLLRDNEISQDEAETLLQFFDFSDGAGVADSAPTITVKSGPYYITDASGNVSSGEPLVINFATIDT